MKNINRSLKIFSVIMLLTFIFSVAAFAEPEGDTSQATQPEIGETVTQDINITENITQETPSVTNTASETEALTSVITTAQNNTPISTTRSRVTTTKKVTTTAGTEKQNESDNADLSSLEVKVVTADNKEFTLILSPKFDANVKTYTAEIKEKISSVEINAKTKSSAAKADVPSDIELLQGNNIIKVVVTAENGTKKTYEINIKYSYSIDEPTTALTTTTTQPQVTQAVSTQGANYTMNTYTKLGIVFAIGGVALLGISIYLFFKKND